MIKRTILTAVALLCLMGTAAAQRHIEFLWRGIYLTGDVSYAMNFNRDASESGFSDTVSALMPSFSVGYQFRKEAAVGIGVSYLADPTGAFTQLPVFVELRSHFMRSRLTPYTALQVGYSFPVGASSTPPVTKINEGGLYLALEVGARYAFNKNFAVAPHVGIKTLRSNDLMRSDAFNKPMLNDVVTLYIINMGLTFYLGDK